MLNRHQIALVQQACQGLLHPSILKPTQNDVIKMIKQMGILQIDTINVVNRSPYLVLWSRIGNFDLSWLEQIHKDGKLFEYWAHAACFIPIEDYPLFRRKMIERSTHWWSVHDWVKDHPDTINHILESIKQKGPLRSSDFPKKSGTNNGWWDWKDEKIALDMLWSKGDLMIPYRKNFQRYYDLRENVVGHFSRDNVPDLPQMNEELVAKTIYILGATRPKWIADYYRLKKTEVKPAVDHLLKIGKIVLVESEDFSEGVLVHIDRIDLIEKAKMGTLVPQKTTILSPFDPLIWDRERTKELYDFDFTLECYLPASKRKYGYFSLPILQQGKLVARMDAKAHRKEKLMEIKNIHFESSFVPDETFKSEFLSTLTEFATWHKTPEILVSPKVKQEFLR